MGDANSPGVTSPPAQGVFVSSQAIDIAPAKDLVAMLRAAGVVLECSPSNPLHASDSRWPDWYAAGLRAAIERCSVFVIVLDSGWDSSTWMAQEADAALQAPGQRQVFFWNPLRVAVHARGMLGYLRTELPASSSEAAEVIVRAAGRRTRRCS